jgi:glycosyltransferase involved in cell wall biosynthesis
MTLLYRIDMAVHVAVLIAARNVAAYVAYAIESVMAQTHRNWTLVVVDDGSTDRTGEVIARYRDPRILLLRQAAQGVSVARNAASAGAGAPEALLFLDADDWLAPNALARLAAALMADPAAVAAHAPYAFVAEGATPTRPGKVERHTPLAPPDLLPRLIRGNIFANGGHVLIRSSAWTAAGHFRRDLSFGEDWEFWTRLALRGRFVAVGGPPVLFVRRRTGSVMRRSAADPAAYRPALAAIAANRLLAIRLGPTRLERLVRVAEAEVNWTVGWELLRRGRRRAGVSSLGRGLRAKPGPRRAALLALVACGLLSRRRV